MLCSTVSNINFLLYSSIQLGWHWSRLGSNLFLYPKCHDHSMYVTTFLRREVTTKLNGLQIDVQNHSCRRCNTKHQILVNLVERLVSTKSWTQHVQAVCCALCLQVSLGSTSDHTDIRVLVLVSLLAGMYMSLYLKGYDGWAFRDCSSNSNCRFWEHSCRASSE